MYEPRVYRKNVSGNDLVFYQVCIAETDLYIGTPEKCEETVVKLVRQLRNSIDKYIGSNPNFLDSLVPVKYESKAPEIIKRMCRASKKAGVGPMAAVAGTVSQMIGEELSKAYDQVIVENGGDIYIKTQKRRFAGIYAGNSVFKDRLAIKIKPKMTPMGICTSSGKIGHSKSFGNSDAVIITAKDAALADAAATAAGNIVKKETDLKRAVEYALDIKGVLGAVAILDDKIAVMGDIELERWT